uniref:Integrase catalytic domain-containing protein n=1 Tax=Nicotiana tabacum TaxID=4097 RepID=A0A1S3ZUV8_TOBAC|nr:PREDICTED: uncharacterized protein LOC107790672 [Nicotiana tabacum]
MAFARLLAQIIRLRAQFSNYAIKTIRLDNVGEFTSQAFTDYCMAIGIKVEHLVAHAHTQNGLVESLIKRLQLIARSLLIRTKLLLSLWEHAILHAAALVRIRTTRGEKKQVEKEIDWNVLSLSHLDPRTNQCEQEVQKIIYMQNVVNQLSNAFTNLPLVTKLHIPTVNAPIRVDVPAGQYDHANESRPRLKRGRLIVEVMQQDEYLEPKFVDECRQRNDWPKWKNTVQAEMVSLEKHEVFRPIVRTPEGVKPVGYK